MVEGLEIIRSLSFHNVNCLNILKEVETEKFSSFLADYIRFQLLKENCERISFETVMSHPSKLDFIKTAKADEWAYRTHASHCKRGIKTNNQIVSKISELYYISAIESPFNNSSRIAIVE